MRPYKNINAETRVLKKTIPEFKREQKQDVIQKLEKVAFHEQLNDYKNNMHEHFKKEFEFAIGKTKRSVKNINENFSEIENILNKYPNSVEKKRIIEIFNILTQSKQNSTYRNDDIYINERLKLQCALAEELFDNAFKISGKTRKDNIDYNKNDPVEKKFLEDSYSLIMIYLTNGKDDIIETFFAKPYDVKLSESEWKENVKKVASYDTKFLWKVYRERIRNNLIELFQIKNDFGKLNETMKSLDRFVYIFKQVAEYIVNETEKSNIGVKFSVVDIIINVLMLIFFASMVYITTSRLVGSDKVFEPYLFTEEGEIGVGNANQDSVIQTIVETASINRNVTASGNLTMETHGYTLTTLTQENVLKKAQLGVEESEKNILDSANSINNMIEENVHYKNFRDMVATFKGLGEGTETLNITNTRIIFSTFQHIQGRPIYSASIGDSSLSFSKQIETNVTIGKLSNDKVDKNGFIEQFKIIMDHVDMTYTDDDIEKVYEVYKKYSIEPDRDYEIRVGTFFSSAITNPSQFEKTVDTIRNNGLNLLTNLEVIKHIGDFSYSAYNALVESVFKPGLLERIETFFPIVQYNGNPINYILEHIWSGLTIPFSTGLLTLRNSISGVRDLYFLLTVGNKFLPNQNEEIPLSLITPGIAWEIWTNNFVNYGLITLAQAIFMKIMTTGTYHLSRTEPFGDTIGNVMKTFNFVGFSLFNISKFMIYWNIFSDGIDYFASEQTKITGHNFSELFTGYNMVKFLSTSTILLSPIIAKFVKNKFITKTGERILHPTLGDVLANTNIFILQEMAKVLLPLFNSLDITLKDSDSYKSIKREFNQYRISRKEETKKAVLKNFFGTEQLKNHNEFKIALSSFKYEDKSPEQNLVEDFLFRCIVIRFSLDTYGGGIYKEKIFISLLSIYIEKWLGVQLILDTKTKISSKDLIFESILDVYDSFYYKNEIKILNEQLEKIKLLFETEKDIHYKIYSQYLESKGKWNKLISFSLIPFIETPFDYYIYMNPYNMYKDDDRLKKVLNYFIPKGEKRKERKKIGRVVLSIITFSLLLGNGIIKSGIDTNELAIITKYQNEAFHLFANHFGGNANIYGTAPMLNIDLSNQFLTANREFSNEIMSGRFPDFQKIYISPAYLTLVNWMPSWGFNNLAYSGGRASTGFPLSTMDERLKLRLVHKDINKNYEVKDIKYGVGEYFSYRDSPINENVKRIGDLLFPKEIGYKGEGYEIKTDLQIKQELMEKTTESWNSANYLNMAFEFGKDLFYEIDRQAKSQSRSEYYGIEELKPSITTTNQIRQRVMEVRSGDIKTTMRISNTTGTALGTLYSTLKFEEQNK